MATRKLYLYKFLKDAHSGSLQLDAFKEEIVISNKWPLIGLDRHFLRGSKMRKVEERLSIKPFEVRQDNFDTLISMAGLLDLKIIYIGFSSDLSEEEHEELLFLLKQNNADKLLDFIDDQRYNMGRDIEEITFVMKSESSAQQDIQVNFTREAVVTVSYTDTNPVEISELFSANSVGVLAGTWYPPLDGEGFNGATSTLH